MNIKLSSASTRSSFGSPPSPRKNRIPIGSATPRERTASAAGVPGRGNCSRFNRSATLPRDMVWRGRLLGFVKRAEKKEKQPRRKKKGGERDKKIPPFFF